MDDEQRLMDLAVAGDVGALRTLARAHERRNTLPDLIGTWPKPLRAHGGWRPVTTLRGRLASVVDAGRRFVVLKHGRGTYSVHSREEALEEVARFRGLEGGFCALHPSGSQMLAVWPMGQVLLVDRSGRKRWLFLPEAPSWTGAPRPAEVSAFQLPAHWHYAYRGACFTADGAHCLVAGYGKDSRACLYVIEIESLAITDQLTQPLAFEYGTWPPKTTALGTWGEVFCFETQLHAPDRVLLASNAGDSFLALFAWSVRDGQLVNLDDLALSCALRNHIGNFLRHVEVEPDQETLLVMDRDFLMWRLRWPTGEPLRKAVSLAKCWRDAGYNLHIWPEDADTQQDLTVGDAFVDVSQPYVLFPVCDYFTYKTHAVVVAERETLLPLGVLRPPAARFAYEELCGLGGGLFAASGKTRTAFWRFQA